MSDEPLVDRTYLLEKFPGKGGWTYAAIPEVLQDKSNPFGWVRVKGKIDDFAFERYKLMPMGNNQLFLPVKAAIRKKIKKEAGDYVRIQLFSDERPTEVPAEIIDCLKFESPLVNDRFNAMTDGERKAYLDWIYDAKSTATKDKRILELFQKLEQGLKFKDKL